MSPASLCEEGGLLNSPSSVRPSVHLIDSKSFNFPCSMPQMLLTLRKTLLYYQGGGHYSELHIHWLDIAFPRLLSIYHPKISSNCEILVTQIFQEPAATTPNFRVMYSKYMIIVCGDKSNDSKESTWL